MCGFPRGKGVTGRAGCSRDNIERFAASPGAKGVKGRAVLGWDVMGREMFHSRKRATFIGWCLQISSNFNQCWLIVGVEVRAPASDVNQFYLIQLFVIVFKVFYITFSEVIISAYITGA